MRCVIGDALPGEAPLPRSCYTISLIVAALAGVAALTGLIDTGALYPTEALRELALPNDVTTLMLGVPMLLGSILLARRHRMAGHLLWPGALLYILYNAVTYLLALPLSWILAVYALIGVLGLYCLILLVRGLNPVAVQEQMTDRVPARSSALVLTVIGGLVATRSITLLTDAMSGEPSLPSTDRALLLVDLLFSPLWLAGGLLLWRRRPWGYAAALPLLFQASSLFLGLIVILLLRPVMLDLDFAPGDVLAVAIMGLICFVPFGRFLRAAWTDG